MNDIENAVENYHFSLRELRKIGSDELPASVTDFLEVLRVRAHIALGSDEYKRQSSTEEQKITLGDD